MKTSDLMFVGIKGSVIALNRDTGQQVWATHLKGADFVNVVLDGENLLASASGEIFCLDPLTGVGRWHNPLKGFGTGFVTLATVSNPGGDNSAAFAEKRRRDDQASASAGT